MVLLKEQFHLLLLKKMYLETEYVFCQTLCARKHI